MEGKEPALKLNVTDNRVKTANAELRLCCSKTCRDRKEAEEAKTQAILMEGKEPALKLNMTDNWDKTAKIQSFGC